MSPSVDPAVANINPNAFVLANQQAQANLATTQQQQGLREQQIALEQQNVQKATTENQLLRQQLNDARIMQQTFAQNPNIDFSDPQQANNFRAQLIKGGVSYPGLTNAMENIPKWQQAIMTLRTSELNNELQAGKRATDVFQNYSQLENGSQAQADAWPAVAQKLNGIPGLGMNLNPGQPLSKEEAQSALSHILIHGQITEDQLKQQQAKQEASKATEEEANAAAAKAKTTHQNLVNDLIQKGQQASQNGQNPIDAIFPADLDKQTHDSYAAAWQAAGAQPPDENGRRPAQDSILSAAASHAAEYRKATSPTIRAGEVATKVAEETATAPIKLSNAIAEAKALREGDNPALAGVPPAAAQFAVSSAAKLDTDYNKAREATESMGKLLDLADSKNVAAGANIPLAGVGAVNAINGIRRINSAEISQYGTAGSLLQKIQGKLEGWKDGEPIPASVRDDIRELHQQLGESAYSAYTQGLNSLNKRTGAKFGPTLPPPNIRKVPAAAPKAAPAVGTVSRGYRFKGGDPSKQENWEKQ